MPAEPDWQAIKQAVAEALELPAGERGPHIATRCPDPAQRAEARRLLRACEQAATSPVLEMTASEFAAPVLAEVHEQEYQVPQALQTDLAGRYTIERELGRGGMATVYLARDERHGRPVALKLLRPELLPDDNPRRSAARFQREIELAARLSHPHILPLYDSGEAGGVLYYIAPYVEGETLRERLNRTGRPQLRDSLRWLRDVARALAHAHRHGVVHRDIKPANILLNQEGDALVADFGVAKALAAFQGAENVPQAELTGGTLVLGTPGYMAPEQVTGGPGIDHRVDLYALGAVAYELLTGGAPFAGRARHEQLVAHLAETPEPVASRRPDVPEALADLVHQLLAKRPDERPGDATEVLDILDGVMAGAALEIRHDKPARATARRDGKRGAKWRRPMIGVAALLAIVAGVVLARGRMMGPAEPVPIAVLPFDVLSDSANTGYLAVGLSDGIASDLGRLRQVVTPGYVTASAYRGTTKSLRQIGSELQVQAVLRGSVQQRNGRVRVDAELVDPETGRLLWGRRFERPASEVLEIQGDIERAVLAELRIHATSSEREVLNRAPTRVSRAYDLYLQGRAVELAGHSREIEHRVPADNIRRAQSLYAQARALDPSFATARARLALMHTLAAATYDTTKARRDQARLEAEAALRRSPGLPEAHEALASYWALEGDLGKAIEELGLALEAFPHSADLHIALGRILADAGRVDEAIAVFDRAMRLEPGSPTAAFLAGLHYSRLRRRGEAMRAFDHAIALAPDYHLVKVIKGHSYLRWKGTPDTLSAAVQTVPADWDPNGMGTYARYTALWAQRRYTDALAMLDHSRSELSRDGLVYQPTSLMRARLYDSMGERRLARASYTTARSLLQDSVTAHPDEPSMRIALGMAYAGLGRRPEAAREVRRAIELRTGTAASAAMGGAVEVFAMTGEFDAAFDLLELLFSMPAGREVTVPYLRVWPGFDPLRSDPRFEELLVRFAADE